MNNTSTCLYRLSHLYAPDKNLNYDERTRITLTYFFACTGIVFLIINSSISFAINSTICGYFDLIAAFFLSILVLWPVKKHFSQFVNFGVFISLLHFLLIFSFGDTNNKSFIWSLTFPLFTFFLLGCKKGLLLNTIFLLCLLSIISFDIATSTIGLYDVYFAIRFSSAFLIICIFSYLYEFFRFKSKTDLEQITKNLELLVNERTLDLRNEVIIKEQLNSELIISKNEWERTFDTVPAHISIIDKNFNIIRANKAMASRVNLPYHKIIGKKCYHIVDNTDAPPPNCPQLEVLKTFKELSTELCCGISNNHYLLTVSPLHDGEGTFIGAVHVAYDISKQKAAEIEKREALDKLRKAEKMETIGLIASGVAHDLNNILLGIVSYPELLLLTTPKENPLYIPLESIKKSGIRASAIVADLLTMARGVSVAKSQASLNEILQDYYNSIEFKNMAKSFPSVKINLDLTTKPSTIMCSPIHILKLLMNLITNAAEAVAKDGQIWLMTKLTQSVEGFSENHEICVNDHISLIIKDNGQGIDHIDIKNIFEPFFSKKNIGRSGTGLGLAIVKNIIDDHKASLDVSSDKSGTIFTITFPICQMIDTQKEQNIDISYLKGTGSVLVVDDDKDQRSFSTEILNFLGYTVTSVVSGEEAIEYCKTVDSDLLFLDYNMDPGINGIQALQEILKFKPNQKAILTGGFTTQDVVIEAQNIGVFCFIKKPYNIKSLAQSLKQTINEVSFQHDEIDSN